MDVGLIVPSGGSYGPDASTRGGAIYAVSQGGTSSETVSVIVGDNATFTKNTADYGGAIYASTRRAGTLTSITIGDNAQFIENSADRFVGGGIYLLGGAPVTLTVGDDAQFIGNSAAGDSGGAIAAHIWGADNPINVTFGAGALFKDNFAAYAGAAIDLERPQLPTATGAVNLTLGVASSNKTTSFTHNLVLNCGDHRRRWCHLRRERHNHPHR